MDIDCRKYLRVLENAFQKHYRERTDEWTHDPEMRAFPAFVQGQLKLHATARVLDIGCGSGADVAYFARIFAHVVGVDIHQHDNWPAITRRQSNVEFFCSAFLKFAGGSEFDLVFDNGCFHHQHPEDYGAYLDKVASILNDDGWFALSTFKNSGRREFIDQNGRLHCYFTDDELHELLAASGFRLSQEFDVYRAKKQDYYRLSLCHR